MATEFEFLRASDKPALLALSTPDLQIRARAVLEELGYKVRSVSGHAEFGTQFSQVQFQVLIFEESFGGGLDGENVSLQVLQAMPMNQRRHATTILIGENFRTMDPMQAFQQSVHAVVSRGDMGVLSQVVQQAVADNDLFLALYRDTLTRLAQAKA